MPKEAKNLALWSLATLLHFCPFVCLSVLLYVLLHSFFFIVLKWLLGNLEQFLENKFFHFIKYWITHFMCGSTWTDPPTKSGKFQIFFYHHLILCKWSLKETSIQSKCLSKKNNTSKQISWICAVVKNNNWRIFCIWLTMLDPTPVRGGEYTNPLQKNGN